MYDFIKFSPLQTKRLNIILQQAHIDNAEWYNLMFIYKTTQLTYKEQIILQF